MGGFCCSTVYFTCCDLSTRLQVAVFPVLILLNPTLLLNYICYIMHKAPKCLICSVPFAIVLAHARKRSRRLVDQINGRRVIRIPIQRRLESSWGVQVDM